MTATLLCVLLGWLAARAVQSLERSPIVSTTAKLIHLLFLLATDPTVKADVLKALADLRQTIADVKADLDKA